MRIGFYAPCNEHNQQTGPLLGIAYIASYLRAELGLEDIYLEVDLQRALDRKPDLLAISSFSEKYNQVCREMVALRRERQDLPVVIGGPHISAAPHTLHPGLNIGVIGEGEKPMAGIVRALQARGTLDPKDLAEIQNLVYWDREQKLQRTVFEDRIKDLDALPLPRRDIMKAWWLELGREVTFDRGVYTSRGCSFRCHFCMYSERANLIRYVSIPKVMEDLESILRDYPDQRHIIFYDDLFVTKKSRLKELADAIRAEGLHKKVTFGCMAKTSFFDREYAQILHDMNIRMISWGFESGADPVLQYLKDRHSTVRKHQEAIDICHRYGIYSGGYFIVGAPPETEAQLAQTYWFIYNNHRRMPLIGIFPILPLPGTTLWTETAERGLIDDDYENWEHLGFLNLDEHYLHLNQHYSKAFLKQAYDEHLVPLIHWPNLIFLQIQNRLQQTQTYLRSVAETLLPQLRRETRVLNLHRGDRWLSFALEEHCELSTCFWEDLTQLEQETAPDLVLLTHTLEKFGFDSPQWQIVQSWQCPVFVLCEQVGFLPHLLALLAGDFPLSLERAEMYDLNYRFTLKTLNRALEVRGYRTRHLSRFSLPLTEQEDQRLREISDFLSRFLPVQAYLQEAHVFAYGLMLEPQGLRKAEAASECVSVSST